MITGAGGFSGQATAAWFEELGYDVHRLLRRPTDASNEHVIDFTQSTAAVALANLPQIDAIVHLATAVDFSESADDALFFPTAVFATSHLCQLARTFDAHFVLASGTLVLEPAPLVDENTKVQADSAYARAKLLAEQIVAGAGVSHTILRIGGIFGRHGPRHLTLNAAIDKAIDTATPPTVYGAGSARRNYVYVYDLASAIERSVRDRIQGIHLYAGSEANTIREMADVICDVLLPDDTCPNEAPGRGARDAVVVSSSALPEGRPFRDALFDIKSREPM